MVDLILAGAEVVTPDGVGTWDLAISDGKIAAVAARNALNDLGGKRLDLTDKVIVPGGIDPHIHCNWPVHDPYTGKTIYTAGPDVVSRAALHGGTTTLIDFVIPDKDEDLADGIERWQARWSGACYSDFSFHILLQDTLSPAIIEQVPEVIKGGLPSFKVFTTNVRPTIAGRKISYGSLWELMQVTSQRNGIMVIHAEDDELVMFMYARLLREGRVGVEYMSEVHSALSEDLAFRRVIRLAEHVPGTALYMMHVSAAYGVEAIRQARARGDAVYGETLHQYALHTDQDYREPDGMKYHTYPSIKSKADADALWAGVASGDIATFGTDELCTSYAEKTAGNRIDNVTGGNTGCEPRMALVYTEVVSRRGWGLKKFVDVTSANAARIFGMYPRKGAIAVGSDADLAVFDPNQPRTITASAMHSSDYTPWEGWEVTAWPVMTILRGRIVVENGQFRPQSAEGQFIRRTLAPEVRMGTAVG